MNDPLHVGRPNIGDRDSFVKYVHEIFERRWLTNNGPLVQELEQRVAKHHNVRHCVAMCNGTIALEIAIRALNLSGEVILPSYTFIATAHALHWQGLTPVFADIDPATHNIDPESVRRLVTTRTTGIIGVHLWGRAAPVAELEEIARDFGLTLIFDAAHAFGCSHGGRMIGGFGSAEVLSFHATKFFNTFEGGAVLTNDDNLAKRIQLMRNFGFAGFDNVIHPGTNGKMVEVCAAMGLVNFDCIDQIVEINRQNYVCYQRALSDIPDLKLLTYDEHERNNFQYIVLEVHSRCRVSRDYLIERLHAKNILARRYFWPGCHRMMPYRELFAEVGADLQRTDQLSGSVIVLPTGSSVSQDDIISIVAVLRDALQK